MLRTADLNHVPPNINLLYGHTYTDLSPQHLLEGPARMGCFLTTDSHLISMHHEEEERKQNWLLRTDSNHVPPNINLPYGRTYTDLSPQHLLEGPARMGCFLTTDSHLISMHHEEEERKQNWLLRTDSNHVPPNINLLYGRTVLTQIYPLNTT